MPLSWAIFRHSFIKAFQNPQPTTHAFFSRPDSSATRLLLQGTSEERRVFLLHPRTRETPPVTGQVTQTDFSEPARWSNTILAEGRNHNPPTSQQPATAAEMVRSFQGLGLPSDLATLISPPQPSSSFAPMVSLPWFPRRASRRNHRPSSHSWCPSAFDPPGARPPHRRKSHPEYRGRRSA